MNKIAWLKNPLTYVYGFAFVGVLFVLLAFVGFESAKRSITLDYERYGEARTKNILMSNVEGDSGRLLAVTQAYTLMWNKKITPESALQNVENYRRPIRPTLIERLAINSILKLEGWVNQTSENPEKLKEKMDRFVKNKIEIVELAVKMGDERFYSEAPIVIESIRAEIGMASKIVTTPSLVSCDLVMLLSENLREDVRKVMTSKPCDSR
jgi:hypothetical protein